MMLFQRRLFYELVGNAVTSALLLTLILVLVSSVRVLQTVDGLSALGFLRSVPIFAAASFELVVPVATLVATVLTYGRAAADNEIDTLRASGVHPVHVLVPGLVFGALMTLALLAASDDLSPRAERARRQLTADEDVAGMLARKLGSGEAVWLDDAILVSIGSIEPDGAATDVELQWSDEAGRTARLIRAPAARIFVDEERGELVVDLLEYRTIIGPRSSGQITIRRALPRVDFEQRKGTLTTAQLMGWQLRSERDGVRRGSVRPLILDIEVAMRFSSAASCFVFVLLGWPVALRFRRSDRVGAFLVAFLLALFLYFPAHKVSSILAEERVLPPEIAAWSGHVLLLAIAVVLSWRVFRR